MRFKELSNKLDLESKDVETKRMVMMAYSAGRASNHDVVNQIAQVCADFSANGGNPDDFWTDLTKTLETELSKTIEEFVSEGWIDEP